MKLLVLLAFAGFLHAQDDIYWFSNYRDAVQEARKTHKPIVLEFRCEA